VVDSVIGIDSRIGAGAHIQRSVLFRDCQVDAKASVVDSILADSVYVSEGARLERCVIGCGQRVDRGEYLIAVKRPEG
jgi:ADP-glucose pyrophosphorylase